MEFIDKEEPDVKKPLIIAAMQDMGNVGSIVVNFINKHLKTIPFREVKSTRPPYVYDKGGYIEIPEEKWEYRYGNDVIVFGGGTGQPQQNDELNELCQDVINVAKRYSAKEACSKALGTGLARGVYWKDIEIINNLYGKPSIILHNNAQKFVKSMTDKDYNIEVSLSDEQNFAIANVIIFERNVFNVPTCFIRTFEIF